MKITRFSSVILPCIAVAIAAFAVIDGRRSPEAGSLPTSPAETRTRVLLGTITRIEPPYLYMRSDDLGAPAEYQVLTSPVLTYAIRLVPWAEGEREKALAEYRKRVDALDPSSGDPIPPPPPVLKPVPLDPSSLEVGDAIGVRSDGYVEAGATVYAIALRPLTEDEIASDRVTVMFPY